jgi:hypothetical protein
MLVGYRLLSFFIRRDAEGANRRRFLSWLSRRECAKFSSKVFDLFSPQSKQLNRTTVRFPVFREVT